jgi:phosphinothricin acetyltransferase
LHEYYGFTPIAIYENVGYKLGGWKSVGWWRLQLNDYHPEPAPPLAFSKLDHQLFAYNFKTTAEKIQSKIIR